MSDTAKCSYCYKILSSCRSKKRHMTTCKVRQVKLQERSDARNALRACSGGAAPIDATAQITPYRAPYHDVTLYKDKPCVYFFQIGETHTYKYGITKDIARRASEHQAHFAKHGHNITLIWIAECDNTIISETVEARIKTFAQSRGLYTPLYGKTEIVSCDDIADLAARTASYVDEECSAYARLHGDYTQSMELAMCRAQIRLAELENERLSLILRGNPLC